MTDYMHPGYRKPYPIPTVLRDLASQEGCDGEPYDAMVFAVARIEALEAKVAELTAERDDARTWLGAANNEFGSAAWNWPDLWRRIAQLKELANERWQRAESAEAKLARASEELSLIAVMGYSDDPKVASNIARMAVERAAKARAALTEGTPE